MKALFERLIQHHSLSREEARDMLVQLATGSMNNSQMAAFMTIFLMRAIRVEELAGFRDAMLELCNAVDLSDFNSVDLCGTGGDGKNTFNISTISSFVTAGAGVHVAKHGNYGVSSVSGSSNVLEHLGCKFGNDPDVLRSSMEQAGICFMHAPLFHPAMKNVAPIRKELGMKTFFNMLGPMVNPAQPANQVVGVFSLELARLYGYLYQSSDKRFAILHALDGYDEISLTSSTKVITKQGERILTAEEFSSPGVEATSLAGGDTIEESATIFTKILSGEGTQAQREVVQANAGLAIATVNELPLEEGIEHAKVSLESGQALKSFKKFIDINS